MHYSISDLRQRPDFFDTVADRIWSAWWQRHGVARGYIVGRLQENLGAAAIPFALVAHRDDVFMGMASVIASDLDERPQYTPWVAAVWVEPQFRTQRLGGALVDAATEAAFRLGEPCLYLCAAAPRRAFYERLGWQPIEEQVGELRLTVFRKDRPVAEE
ncbi:GNAT family N-acetyltransferase [Bradyrhizobium sp. U87765 SZCCT0131]|uniref:GNAT family N-acetyltransferase n=1 Tax=unclassified Bradyrhizobium TaxID=2631580 RepID=UPI001BA52AE5|nr:MULTISPECIES: GNAT family N-acetyltransferase [unclassified Bradyrhizobium]MBR1218174.1 GNAT family N-acetyltransferase [Bradyrhizobium sp. U87765 SZCCT0131]MBR1260880.1 GNAT family N-acetyltransferase [Bradyrhizobium sp. U87765 SZCCT0134]MBR1303672.1 GNAT family N-acetyltransferase [Bradyrhizobium sp. U87765 SZCCT0110]MBR1319278.1 GNAT family N-acetyltransferase [Bradyrhizobium sp. U87765 SZCCT0109]MBR1347603.1 GNAT family N-acetyltransferase [Bradyrhizobium sp. U87765 SZCCT0048]